MNCNETVLFTNDNCSFRQLDTYMAIILLIGYSCLIDFIISSIQKSSSFTMMIWIKCLVNITRIWSSCNCNSSNYQAFGSL